MYIVRRNNPLILICEYEKELLFSINSITEIKYVNCVENFTVIILAQPLYAQYTKHCFTAYI